MKVLFLFIDGVGLRSPAPDNPVNPEVSPVLCRLIEQHGKPIDACLGVEGTPQSATGQATMFTGINASQFMGHHCEGFPGPSLRAKITENNIFLELKRRGRKVCFADAYLIESADELSSRRFKSVTTTMALTTPEVISTLSDLADGQALFQDITCESIQDRYPDLPSISPETAASRLFSIARGNDFTLYEYFQTDVAGHTCDYDRACTTLRLYDRFLGTLVRYTQAFGIQLVMTADHGNIENMTDHGHSQNPIPFIAVGPREVELRDAVNSLVDVTPAILKLYDT